MTNFKLDEDLRPLTDLKTRTREVVEQVRRTGRPVVLTRYGKGVAVLLSVKAFHEYQEASAQLRLLGALRAAAGDECASDADEHEDWDAPPGPGEAG